MKPEVYSCIKMFEALKTMCVEIHNSRHGVAAVRLGEQYLSIYRALIPHLTAEQKPFIPGLESYIPSQFSAYEADKLYEYQLAYIASLGSACSIAIGYLKSLGGSYESELSEKEALLKEKEKELEMRENGVQQQNKIAKESLEIMKQMREAFRSEAVAKFKKHHREIEKNENPRKKKV